MGSLKKLAPYYNTGFCIASTSTGGFGLFSNTCTGSFSMILLCSIPYIFLQFPVLCNRICTCEDDYKWSLYRGIIYMCISILLLCSPIFIDCIWGLIFGIFGLIGSVLLIWRYFIAKNEIRESTLRREAAQSGGVFTSLNSFRKFSNKV